MSSADGRGATRALHRLRDLREAVYPIVLSAVRGEPPQKRALARLEQHWKSGVASARLTSAEGRAALDLDVERSRLDYPRHVLALAAVELVRTLPLERTRECATCTWIFIDTSRGGQRRWCSMATCGNIEKSRRHYELRRARRTAPQIQ